MLKHFLHQIFGQRQDQPSSTVIAFAWYEENQWPLLRQVSLDADWLENTYGEWLKVAEARYTELLQQGRSVEKVVIDVPDLFAWSREMGHKGVTAESRTLYAIYRLKSPMRKNTVTPSAEGRQ